MLKPGLFKAYDVRGTYPDEINERRRARAIGAAFVAYLGARRIAVGRDMRLSSPGLARRSSMARRRRALTWSTTG